MKLIRNHNAELHVIELGCDYNHYWDEGFDYCFRFYSNFSDIKDEKFQKLREKYEKIANELEQYVNSKIED